jgi:release factor glutamine methyltransferase
VTQTVEAALREAAQTLRDGGIETAALDGRLLLCHASGLTHEALIARNREALPPEAVALLDGYVARRLQGEPVSRIKGNREFYGRHFEVDAHTLDPRPDTETLIEAALAFVTQNGWRDRPLRLLDLGTGSGCILLTLLAELPQAQGIGTDMSEGALRRAAGNASRLGLADRARFIASDWFDGVPGRFDLILSNPPYIASGEIAGLAREVSGFDPMLALDGGADGLDAYRCIAKGALQALKEGGQLVVEIGSTQAEAVADIFRAAGLNVGEDSVHFDLAGRARCVLAGGSEGLRGTSNTPKNELGKPRCSG